VIKVYILGFPSFENLESLKYMYRFFAFYKGKTGNQSINKIFAKKFVFFHQFLQLCSQKNGKKFLNFLPPKIIRH
jgi:hypothetical protein